MTAPPLMLVPPDAATHREVQALLPWHATQALQRNDALRVEAHLVDCARCQADLQWERRLVLAHRKLAVTDDVERGFDALLQRIASPRRRLLPAPLRRLLRSWRDARPWVRGTLVLQFGLVLTLAAALLFPRSHDDYRALGSAAPIPANLLVKFRPDTPEAEIRRALAECGARFAGGPTASAAYLLMAPPGSAAAVLARLRAQPGVLLAESLDAGEAAR